MNRPRLLPIGLLFLVFSGLSAAPAQQAQQPDDPALSEAKKLLKAAREEIDTFQKSGGKTSDPDHPAVRWSRELWDFRGKHPGTAAAGFSASEAIHLLVHANRFPEVQAWADALAPDDPAWEHLPRILLEAATLEKDYGYVIRKLGALREERKAERFLPGIAFYLGRAFRGKGDEEAAKAAFEEVVRLAGDSDLGKRSSDELFELTALAIGQPAPQFSMRARDGSQVSLADFHGKAVLLIFWAST